MRRTFMLAAGAIALCCPTPGLAQDYGDPRQMVDQWYRTFLRRAPEYPGAEGWVDQLRGGNSPDSVLSSILGSDEYYAICGSTPQGYVQGLYRDLLGRRASPREQDRWARRLYTEGRQDVAYHVLTGNAGAWDGRFRHGDGDRERRRLRELEEDDYRRPAYPYRR